MEKKVNYLVEKSNTLNTLRSVDMTLNELRFFCMYISKLNPHEPEKRTIVIPISEFEAIFEVKLNTTLFKKKIKQILHRSVEIKLDNEIVEINLYSQFRWKEVGSNLIEVTCNYDIVPYLFELQKNYTTYMIGNISKLNSIAEIRLYEIFKQYEKLTNIKINLEELQDMMCVKHRAFKFLKRDVLEPAIKDINKYTDVEVSYEKVLSSRKVVALNFTIKPKIDAIVKSIVEPEVVEDIPIPMVNPAKYRELESIYLKCNKAYTLDEISILYDIIENANIFGNPSTHLISIYLNIRARERVSNAKVSNYYQYTLKIINNEIDEYNIHSKSEYNNFDNNNNSKVQSTKKERSYNIEDFKDFVRSTPRQMVSEEYFEVYSYSDNRLRGYIYRSEFDTIINGTWRNQERFKNCYISEVSSEGLKLIDLINMG